MSETTLQLLTSRSVRKNYAQLRPHEISRELQPLRLVAHVIVGLQVADDAYEMMKAHQLTGQEKRRTLTLSSPVAERFRTFFTRTQSHPDGTKYECYSFTSFTQGAESDILPFDAFTHEPRRTHRPIQTNNMAEGQPYVAVNNVGDGVHATLGGNMPYLNVGVLGPDEELAFTVNADILPYYGAVAIHGLAYPGARL